MGSEIDVLLKQFYVIIKGEPDVFLGYYFIGEVTGTPTPVNSIQESLFST